MLCITVTAHLCLVVFSVEPDLIREGGTIPIAKTFQDVTGKSIIMLPIGGFDDGLHSQNEKISRSLELLESVGVLLFMQIHSLFNVLFFRYNYIEGTKLFIAYLHEVSQIKKYWCEDLLLNKYLHISLCWCIFWQINDAGTN